MRLHEYHAKSIFAKYGIRIPRGKLARDLSDVESIVKELGCPVVLKSQVLVGGRGKAGGIKKANDVKEALELAKKMFGMNIKGHIVKKIYVEEQLDIEREMYVGYTVDRASKGIAAIVSSVGGMDIEEMAEKHPEKIAKITINPKWGLWDYQIRNMLKDAEMPKEYWKELARIMKILYKILLDYEAELTEINPLVLTPSGLFAADARLNIDDSAIFRHKNFEELKDYTEADETEKIATQKGLNYVKLDGNIGVMANGAGMAMSTMDLIYLEGGKPANFLDIGGGASSEVVKEAMNIILMDENVKAVFINIFGGITRCDEVAKGLINAFNDIDISVPIVIRLAGTNEEEGKDILKDYIEGSNLDIHIVETMEEGAKKIVELSR